MLPSRYRQFRHLRCVRWTEGGREERSGPLAVRLHGCVIRKAADVKLYSDERYMVARILVGITVSIITRMDNPKWFKENAEPHVFSQTRYEKTVEDLKALGAEDPNAVQALVCDVTRHLLTVWCTQSPIAKERALGCRGG